MSDSTCPGCGSDDVRVKGAIPDNHLFAGNDVGSMPARLAVCRSCHLGFRSPQPSAATLAALYEAGSETAWSENPGLARTDWELAAGWVERIGATRVLDVGCFDGGFLELLPSSVVKAGVEINPAAAQRAAQRGITIVAEDLHDLATVTEAFDFVSAFDVIEHVNDPGEFLAALAAVTSPGGHVVFATGNLDAPTWRMMGSRYLYSWFLEHISFVSPQWVSREASRLGLEVVSIDRFSHTPSAFLSGLLKNAIYRTSPRLLGAVRARAARRQHPAVSAVPAPPPAWSSARDHILVVLRKSA